LYKQDLFDDNINRKPSTQAIAQIYGNRTVDFIRDL